MVEARREKIFIPRAEYLVSYFGQDRGWKIGDIGAGFGLFLEELRKLWPASNYVAIEPSIEQAKICEQLSVQVECCTCEELKGHDGCFQLLTAFELLEHLFEPVSFLGKACSLLKPGGYLFLTTLNGEGFDILTLRDKSKSVSPPHHLNFFNPASLELLLKKIGFEIIDISTPGRLDWDIVEGMIINEKVNVGYFWKLFAEKGTPDAKKDLQDWISRYGFSSHMQILARKRA
jgi:2-polyprenyl-3-methyl-5-hydroxy-6-metoxy-1,4-benzoquinol methylase